MSVLDAPAPVVDDPVGEMVRRVADADEAAFEAFYDLFAPVVHGVVLRVVRDPSQAEEVTQEVFVTLWRSAPTFDPAKGSAHAWVATVAHRRAVDRVRSEQASRDRSQRDAAQTARTTPPHDVVVASVDSSMQRARVRRAMERLSAPQREAVELAYFGGHTYREVALLLGVPEGTVKTRIRDGMLRLRTELEGER